VFLLDTNVVSELRRPRPHGALLDWIEPVSSNSLFLSVVSIGEIQIGIELTRRHDPGKAADLERWLAQVLQTFQVLDLDAASFRVWARLMQRTNEHHTLDAMIAATAVTRGLTVVTRNTRHFRPFGVAVVNPFVSK
jgi:predicted nucleic acid-binding protein